MRLAEKKLKETKVKETYAASLETLITEYIFKNYPVEPWQGFRDNHLWKIEVSDLFEINLSQLEFIWKSFTDQRKRVPEYEDMHHLCMQIAPCGVSEMDVKFAFGMCKMTVVSEAASYKDYNRIQFVEFLEFIGRLAYVRFKDSSEMSSLPLATKVEYILDDIFAGYGMTRKDVENVVEEFSESDDDY